MSQLPLPTQNSGLRVFSASLLSALLIMMPFVQLAAAQGQRSVVRSQPSDVRSQALDGKQVRENKTAAAAENVFLNPPLPKPAPEPPALLAPSITATLDDGVAAGSFKRPGETITYTATITNGGPDPATGVTFTNDLTGNANLTFVPGSVQTQPIAFSDSFNVLGNVRIQVPDGASDLLNNDTDPDQGNNSQLTITTLAGDGSAPFDGTSVRGGNVTATSGDGSFQYNPPVGYEGADSFTYTVTDNTGKTDTATVNITITGMIWFINNAATACTTISTALGCGRLTNPLSTLASFESENGNNADTNGGDVIDPEAGDHIFIYTGNSPGTPYSGSLTLENTQRVVGQGASDTIVNITGVTLPTHSDALPATGGTRPTITTVAIAHGIVLANTNTIRGLTVGITGGTKLIGTNFGTLTIGNNTTPDVELINFGPIITLTNGTFAATSALIGVSTTGAPAHGISLDQVAGTVSLGSTTISGHTTQGIVVTGSTVNVNFGNTSITGTGSTTDGVALSNNSAGTRTFGTLTISSGNGIGFRHFDPDGAVVTQTGGGAVSVTGATSITNPSGVGIDIDRSNADLTFAGTTVNKNATGNIGVDLTNNAGRTITFSSLTVTTTNAYALNTNDSGTVNVTNGVGSSLTQNGAGGGAASLTSTALGLSFTSVSSNGGVNGLLFSGGSGTFTSGTTNLQNNTGVGLSMASSGVVANFGNTTVHSSANDAVDLSLNTANITFADLDLTPDSGLRGLDAQGNTGTITSTSGDISTTNEAAVFIDGPAGLTPFNLVLTNVSANVSAGTAANAVSVTDASGTLTLGGGTITGGNAPAFVVNTGTANITYNGTIGQSNAQRGVDVQNKTGGTVSFGGAITASTSTANAIHLATNAGATINFTAGLNITTTSGVGFNATGGGIVSATQNNTSILNTISSTTGTALNVANTTIGASGLTFRSITSNGGLNGIVLNSTGSSGGLTVTGNGGTCTTAASCSGGSIQNKTGDAISLISTNSVSLTRMFVFTSTGSHIDATTVNGLTLQDCYLDLSTDHGILGSSVTAFVADNCMFDRGGAGSGSSGKHGIFMTNLLGTSSVTDSTFKRSNTIQFFVTNTTRTTAQPATATDILTLSHNTWNEHTGAFGGDHFSLLAAGTGTASTSSNMRLVVNGTGGENKTGGLLAAGNNEGGNAYNVQATNTGKVTTSITAVDAMNVTSGVNIAASTGGTIIYDIFSNKTANGTGFQHHGIMAFNVACINSTCDGKFRDNSITHSAPANVNAVNIVQEGSGTNTIEITSNTISGSFQRAIHLQSRLGTGQTNATVTGNTMTATNTGGLQVFNAETGSSTVAPEDYSNKICLDLANNSATPAGTMDAYRLRNRGPSSASQKCTGCVFQLEGFGGNGSNAADIATWVTTTKSNTGTPVSASIDNAFTSSGGCATSTAMYQPEQSSQREYFASIIGSEIRATITGAANTGEVSTSNAIFLTAIASTLTSSASETGARIAPPAHKAELTNQTSVARAAEIVAQESGVRTHHAVNSRLETRNAKPELEAEVRSHHATASNATRNTNVTVAAPLAGNFTVNIGTLPAGDSVTITFQVTIAATLTPAAANSVSNQGQVSGNFTTVNTDDPQTGTAGDATVTPIDKFEPTIDIQSSDTTTNQGDSVTFTATLTHGTALVDPLPTGTVSFVDQTDVNPANWETLCLNVALTVNVNNSTAQCVTTGVDAGTRTIAAVYSGDGRYDTAADTVTQTVTACASNPVVNSASDPGDGTCDGANCTLREAITNACSGSTITFDTTGVFSDPETILLTGTELSVATNVTIDGPDAAINHVTVNGDSDSRVFNINSGITVTLRDFTITNGSATGNGGGILNLGTSTLINVTVSGSEASTGGGGIKNDGTLTLKNSTVSGNKALQNGAGIHNSSVLNIVNSTISGNISTIDGGGLVQDGVSSTLYMVNSTVSGNTANGYGGGLDLGTGTVTILNSTITGNHGDNDDGSGGGAGGIRQQTATVTIRNTIVAGNYLGSGTTTANDIDGTVSGNNNLIGDAGSAGGLTNNVNGNIVGAVIANVLDTVLANNGGPTKTHRLITGSAALDAGQDGSLPTDVFDADGDANAGEPLDVDQRGQPRVVDNPNVPNAVNGLDIGAYEAPAPPSTPDLDAASDTGASSTDNYTSDNTPTFTISGVTNGAFVELLAGASVVASGTAVGTSIQLTSSVLTDNTYSFTARQTVGGGLSPTSTGLSVTIDTGGPGAPTIDLVAASDSGSSNTDNITNAATRTFDIGNTESGATVQLFRDGNPVGGTTTGNGGTVQLSDSTAAVSGTTYAYTTRQIDGAGNQADAGPVNVVFDNVGPTVNMTSGASNPTNTSPIPVTVTFNESVSGFTVADITPGNATVNNFAGSGANYTFDLVPSGQGTVTADIGAAVAQDTAGNDNTAATQFSRTFDTDAPTANITDVSPDPRNNSVSSITIVFSEAVTGFDLTDLTLTRDGGGNLLTGAQTLSSGDGGVTWTLGNLSGITGAQGTYLLTLTASGSGITDAASNALTGNATDSWVMDTSGPTVTINQAAGQLDPTSSSPINFTVVFNEPVTGFTNTDVAFSGAGATTATVTETAPNDGTTYNVAISGMNADGTVQASVNVDAAQDGAGNNSAASTSGDNQVQFVAQLAITIQDAKVAEPSSGSANLIFTVTLSAPAITTITVDFTTVDGTAKDGVGEANQDYTNTSGTITFTAGQQVRTIHVPVVSDSDNSEVDETLTVTLSNQSSNSTVADGTGNGTITVASPAGTLLISEFRQFGPGLPGPTNDLLDDFVEIYNNTNSAITVPAGGYGLFRMATTCLAGEAPQLIGTIPQGTVIPARGHFLFSGPTVNYSLEDYGGTHAAVGDALLTADLGANENFGLFATTDVTKISSVNRFDAVGFGANNQNACDLLREGSTLPELTVSPTLGQHSYFRKMCDWIQGSGCTVPGIPKDTNQNANDFWLADANGSALTGRLGAPGPENLTSPISRDNSGLSVFRLDGNVSSTAHPNRTRNTSEGAGSTPTQFGTMTTRSRVTNNTGVPVTRLRYRIVDMSTAIQPPGPVADLRALTGVLESSVGPVNDPVTCAISNGGNSSTPCNVAVDLTTLETPPAQPNGGGYNSTLSSGTVTTGTPLLNGSSILINFKLGVQKTGTFRFYIIVEALP